MLNFSKFNISNWVAVRSSNPRFSLFSTIITKNELVSLINSGKNLPFDERKYVLVDVREPQELKTQGTIETSVNIPLGQLETALQLPEHEFKEKYGFSKMKQDNLVVFSCKAGIRAQKACDLAEKLGYKNVSNYFGSASEWFNFQG